MSAAERGQMAPYLEAVDLPVRMKLARPRYAFDYVYFLDHGMVSVVARANGHDQVEVALIGSEGAACSGVFLDAGNSTQDIHMQSAGSGQRIRASDISRLMEEVPSIRRKLMHYLLTMSAQIDATAVAGMRGTLNERLARWLLMAQDRLGDDIYLTHEFLAAMLGVRRAGVTTALGDFLKISAIKQHRAHIAIEDRQKLQGIARHFYGAPEAEYARLFPTY
jgi:hypothetical protein